MKLFNRISILAVLFAGFTTLALAAQVNSNAGSVTLTYTVPESISITVTGSGAIDPVSTNTGNIVVNGTYTLIAANHQTKGVRIAAFPAGGLTALLTGPANVPSSAMNSAFNGVWGSGGCTNPDADNVNAGVADLCSTPQTLLTPAALTATPTGTLPTSTFVFGFAAGQAPVKAGSYSGAITLLVYAP